jgi:hypothetical protein
VSISSPPSARPDRSHEAILAAVLDDVRNTLRVGWIDPALRTLAFEPVFLSAAWAATRPNVTRSFAAGAERLQREAVEAARRVIKPTDVSDWTRTELSGIERERLLRTAQALQHSAARVYLVVQAWTVLARRQVLPGTGKEEQPAKRGIPSWQEGLSGLPRTVSPEAEALIDDATVSLGLSATPSTLPAAASWPHYLESLVGDLRAIAGTDQWKTALMGLRRTAAGILTGLPHPMDLQWDVLDRKGFTEERRAVVADHLIAATSAMPANAVIAAAMWISLGEPEIPAEF